MLLIFLSSIHIHLARNDVNNFLIVGMRSFFVTISITLTMKKTSPTKTGDFIGQKYFSFCIGSPKKTTIYTE